MHTHSLLHTHSHTHSIPPSHTHTVLDWLDQRTPSPTFPSSRSLTCPRISTFPAHPESRALSSALFFFFITRKFCIGHRQSPLDPVDPSFRALYGRLQSTVRRHKFNQDSLFASLELSGKGGGREPVVGCLRIDGPVFCTSALLLHFSRANAHTLSLSLAHTHTHSRSHTHSHTHSIPPTHTNCYTGWTKPLRAQRA